MDADLVPLVLGYLADDYPALFKASIACKFFSQEAARLLYARVVFAPRLNLIQQLNFRSDPLTGNGLWQSALLEKNAAHVKELVISGCPISGPTSKKALVGHLQTAIRTFKNLRSLEYTPDDYDHTLSMKTIDEIMSYLDFVLKQFTLTASCLDESGLDIIINVLHLESLTILSPSGPVLDLLPEWLHFMEDTNIETGPLKELHLKDNCSLITPDALRSIRKYTKHLTAFSLGISCYLTDVHVFDCLRGMPNLQVLHLHHYEQLATPPDPPRLYRLRAFTIDHSYHRTGAMGDAVGTWIVRFVDASPVLEELTIFDRVRNDLDLQGDVEIVRYDLVAQHILDRCAARMKVLKFPYTCLSNDLLRSILEKCAQLENLAIRLAPGDRDTLTDMLCSSKSLRTLSIELVSMTDTQAVKERAAVERLFRAGPWSLSSITAHHVTWLASRTWVQNTEGSFEAS